MVSRRQKIPSGLAESPHSGECGYALRFVAAFTRTRACGGRRPGAASRERRRPAFTIMEVVVALGILATVMMVVAQIAAWSMQEQGRRLARQLAIEQAGNLLEAARACPWDQLDPAWAAVHKRPKEWDLLLPTARLTVRLELEKDLPQAKRLTVEISWKEENRPEQQVRLTSLFSARSAGAKP